MRVAAQLSVNVSKVVRRTYDVHTCNSREGYAGNKSAEICVKVMQRFHTLQPGVVSRAGLFWSDSGLSLPKCFGPISGLHTKLFHNI